MNHLPDLARWWSSERRIASALAAKVIPRFPNKKAALKLVFATMIRAANRWCRISFSDLERHQLKLLRAELGLDPWMQSVAALVPSLFPSHSRSFADVRLLPREFSDAGRGRCRLSTNSYRSPENRKVGASTTARLATEDR